MAYSKQAKKRIRQTITRTARNRANRTYLKSVCKAVEKAVLAKDFETGMKAYETAQKTLDKFAAMNFIHKNRAARKKSRLLGKLNALKAQPEA